jgi:Ca2+-binding EF-hand superfamily protein
MRAALLALLLMLPPAAGLTASKPKPDPVFITPSGETIHPTPAAPDAFATWFDRLDARHEGRIDRAEFRADAEQFFHKLDLNHDGAIDGFEIAAYEKSVAADLDIAGQGFAFGSSENTISLLSDPEPVSSADLELNAHITLAEWLTVADRRFDLLDPKHQGYLTREGLDALLPKWFRERERKK